MSNVSKEVVDKKRECWINIFLSRINKNKKTTISSEQLQEHNPEENNTLRREKLQEFRASKEEAPYLTSQSPHLLPWWRVCWKL